MIRTICKTSLTLSLSKIKCAHPANGGNLPWGQGQTPIKEVLQLLKKEKWPIYADIELEYRVPPDSDSVKEVAKCVEYCREALA